MKKLLIHTCCAPCLAAPYFFLKKDNYNISIFWFNHNIHPFEEYQKRLICLDDFCSKEGIMMIKKDEYLLESFLRKTAFREKDRCYQCYYDRIKYTAIIAKKGNFNSFTTTLLYSKFQKHELLKSICENIARDYNIDFFYHDFRELWKQGIDFSKRNNMYRQTYCGCIYSEKERFLKKK